MEAENASVAALPPLREVIHAHGLRAEKKLGQNFLLDLNLTGKIARQTQYLRHYPVFEIGPGPGGLTRALLIEGAPHVFALEYDPRAVEALQSLAKAAKGRLTLVAADALTASLPDIAHTQGFSAPYIIAANLPYNIATPLLLRWLRDLHGHPGLYAEMVLMFQKEVAQRIVAKSGTKAYGRLSVMAQWLCDAKILFDVGPSAFTPPPKVTSSIVHLRPKQSPHLGVSFEIVERLTAAAFGQRRKMIRSSLKDYAAAIEKLGLDSTKRAEDLSVDEYLAIAALI